MNKWVRYFCIFLLFCLVAYKCGFTIVYQFMLYVPGVIFRTMHPVEPYHYTELGHVQAEHTPHVSSPGGLKRPNIILIVADDLAVNDLSGHGGVQTPNIDSIARNGVSFNNAYAGQATCAPSRASLYTGRYPTRFGFEFTPITKILARMLALPKHNAIYHPIFHRELLREIPPMTHMVVPRNQTMIAEMLHDEGYLTYFLGKWHLGETPGYRPLERGFTESLCFLMGASQYLDRDNASVVSADLANNMFIDDFLRLNLPFSVTHNNGPDFKPNEYMTDYLSKAVVKLIHNRHRYNEIERQHRAQSEISAFEVAVGADGGATGPQASSGQASSPHGEEAEESQPFFVTVAYNAPHNPMQALHGDYYSAELNATFDGPSPYIPHGGTEPLSAELTHTARVYAAMIMAMDRGVGQIIEALRATDQLDNTLLMFTSDNGGAAYLGLPHLNYPYRGWKASFFEGGVRVPFSMQWPQVIRPTPAQVAAGGIQSDVVVSHVDIFATIAGAASVSAPAPETAAPVTEALPLRVDEEGSNHTAEKPSQESAGPGSSGMSVETGEAEAEIGLSIAQDMAHNFVDNVTTLGSSLLTQHYGLKLVRRLIRGVLHLVRTATSSPRKTLSETEYGLMYTALQNGRGHRLGEVVNFVRNRTAALVNRSVEFLDSDSLVQLLPANVIKFNRLTRRWSKDSLSTLEAAISPSDDDDESGAAVQEEEPWVHVEHRIDGINLLPLVVDSSSAYHEAPDDERILHDHYLLPNNVTIAERVLFWRSGHYSAVQQPSIGYKLQVSEKRPDKVWFCDLKADPLEHVNIASLLGITTSEQLLAARSKPEQDPVLAGHKQHLYELYDALVAMQSVQSRPLWPALIEFPEVIDKTAMEDEKEGDEYIYWAN